MNKEQKETNVTPDKMEEIDLVGKYAEKAMFIKSREIDEANYPFIKKLTDEEYITFRDVIRTTLTQYHQDLMSEVEKKVLSALEDRLVEEDGREIVGFQQEDQGVRIGLGMAKRIVREVFIKSK